MAKILLVEDDTFISDFVSTQLIDKGFDMAVAGNSEAAFEKLKSETPDLVLLDLELPGAHGFTILEEMKQSDEYKAIPVIIFSNDNSPENRQQAATLGAVQFCTKASTDPAELYAMIEKYLPA